MGSNPIGGTCWICSLLLARIAAHDPESYCSLALPRIAAHDPESYCSLALPRIALCLRPIPLAARAVSRRQTRLVSRSDPPLALPSPLEPAPACGTLWTSKMAVGCGSRVVWLRLGWFVADDADRLWCCEPVLERGAEGVHGSVDCCLRARVPDVVNLCALPVADTTYSGEELLIMEVVHRRCAGIDIAKRSATVCVRVAGEGRRRTAETVTTWGSMTNQILALREHLVAEQVSCVAMEATGDYWKPFYYLLEDAGFELLLANARQVKNMPGRKTDVSDAVWLAQLAAHGLVRGSLVPPSPIRQLRDLTEPGLGGCGTGPARSLGWSGCWRMPASNCPRSPASSTASPAVPCCRR